MGSLSYGAGYEPGSLFGGFISRPEREAQAFTPGRRHKRGPRNWLSSYTAIPEDLSVDLAAPQEPSAACAAAARLDPLARPIEAARHTLKFLIAIAAPAFVLARQRARLANLKTRRRQRVIA